MKRWNDIDCIGLEFGKRVVHYGYAGILSMALQASLHTRVAAVHLRRLRLCPHSCKNVISEHLTLKSELYPKLDRQPDCMDYPYFN